jgi:hypothetical protein
MDLLPAHLKGFGQELMKLSTELSPEQKAELYRDVAKKYPNLANDSSSKERAKIGGAAGTLGKALGAKSRVGQHLVNNSHAYDLAGLGVLAAPSVANLAEQNKVRGAGGMINRKEVGHSLAEVGGLGILAAPVAAQMLTGRH